MNKQTKLELELFYREIKDCKIEDTQVGSKLKYLRECMNISQAELAKRVGVDRSAIIRYESNKSLPRLQTLEKLLTALYADVRVFIHEEVYDETKVIDEELRDYDKNGHLIRIFKGRFQKKSQKHFNKLAENDIFKLQQEFEERIDQCLFYKHNGQNVLIPGEVLSFIKTNVSAAFKVLDTLPHDKE